MRAGGCVEHTTLKELRKPRGWDWSPPFASPQLDWSYWWREPAPGVVLGRLDLSSPLTLPHPTCTSKPIFFYFFFFAFPAHCWRVRGAQEHGECFTPSPCPPHCCKAVAVEASPWLWEGCGGERWDQHQYLGEEHNPTASSRAVRREQLYWDHLWVLLLVSSLGPFK